MAEFEVTGDLFTDVQNCIDNSIAMQIDYTDRKGAVTARRIAPREIRGIYLYAIDLDKMGLRMFILDSIGDFTVLDETFDPNIII